MMLRVYRLTVCHGTYEDWTILKKKSRQVMAYLTRHAVHIAFLQETHFLPNNTHSFALIGELTDFFMLQLLFERGCILVHKNLPFHSIQVIGEPDGRYVIVQRSLAGKDILLINIYAPNIDSTDFFPNLHTEIENLGIDNILFGGDFNLSLDLPTDTSGPTRVIKPHSIQGLRSLLQQLLLADPWHVHHPGTRTYSFYSAPHSSWSRIDHWYLTPQLLLYVCHIQYLPRTISDHSPVLLQLDYFTLPKQRPQWCFPSAAVLDPVFKEEINVAVRDYFDINTGSVDSQIVLWGAFKAVIRGVCISKHAGISL